MACGKSSIGKKLAKGLNMPFLDLDKAIVQKAGMSIPEIFDKQGATVFRKMEQQCLQDTFTLPPTIIATGGGAPCFFNNIKQMNQYGTTYYLDVPISILTSRLFAGKATRPLVSHFTEKEALQTFIETKLAERLPFYQQAQVIVDCAGKVQDVVDFLKKLEMG